MALGFERGFDMTLEDIHTEMLSIGYPPKHADHMARRILSGMKKDAERLCEYCPGDRCNPLKGDVQVCDQCRPDLLIDCDCGALYWDVEEFRDLPLDTVLSFSVDDRMEIRRCACGELLKIDIDRNGEVKS